MDKKNKRWSKKGIVSIIENFAIATGHKIIPYTEKIDKALPATELSSWMDSVSGFGHRAKHGHDFLANIGDVYKKFGAEGVAKYPVELMQDATTPHGIPIPGTQFLVQGGVVKPGFATEWLSLNVADIFTGGIAAYSTYKLYKKSKNEELDKKSIFWATVGIGVKTVAGVTTSNPILIISGVSDTAILIWNWDQAREAFKKYLDFDIASIGKATVAGLAAGGGTALATTTAVTALGTASTGTAISTLGGAAASNAMLAAIGGGSLASGGLGVAGGIAILSGGSLLLAGAVGYGAYRFIKKRQKKKLSE